jgi:tetratricopeptide (TPR) repeat protein
MDINYEQAFNYLEQLKLSLQDISKEEFPEKQICYSQIGYYYYQFHDWQTAIENLKLGLQEKPSSIIDQYQMLC